MSQLEEILGEIRAHEGVEQVVLLGRDGLVVRHAGEPGVEDAVAALAPSLAGAADALGAAFRSGRLATAVLEYERGVGIVLPVSADLLLALLLRPGVGFARLLQQVRRDRTRIAAAL